MRVFYPEVAVNKHCDSVHRAYDKHGKLPFNWSPSAHVWPWALKQLSSAMSPQMSFHTGTFQYLAKQRLMFFLWVRVIKKRKKEKKKELGNIHTHLYSNSTQYGTLWNGMSFILKVTSPNFLTFKSITVPLDANEGESHSAADTQRERKDLRQWGSNCTTPPLLPHGRWVERPQCHEPYRCVCVASSDGDS